MLRHIKSVCVSTGMVGHVSVTSEARQGVSAPGHKLAQVSGGVRELKICGTKTLKTTFFFPCRVAALWVSNHLPHTLSQLQSFSTPHVKLQVCYSSNILDTPKSPFSDAFFFFSSPYVEVFPSLRRCHRNQPRGQEVAAWRSCKEHICFVR